MFVCNSKFKKIEISLSESVDNEIYRINELLINTLKISENQNFEEILGKFGLKKDDTAEDLDFLSSHLNDLILTLLEKKLLEDGVARFINKNRIYVYDKNKKIIYFDKLKYSDIEFKLNQNFSKSINELLLHIFESKVFDKIDDKIKNIVKSFIELIQIEKIFNFDNDMNVNFFKINIDDLIKSSINYDDEVIIKKESAKKHIYPMFFEEKDILTEDEFRFNILDDKDEIKGVLISNFIFCDDYVDTREKIKKENRTYYDFQYINECLDFNDKKIVLNEPSLLSEFKDKRKEEELLKELSKLNNNIYSEKPIHSSFEKFFESGKLIETKEPIDLQFFVPEHDENDESLLGVYNNNDDNGTRGLKLWIDKKHVDQNYYQDKGNSKLKKSKNIKHLKPSLYYYYEKEFFEDLLFELFEELKSNGKIIDFQYSVKTFYSTEKINPLDGKSKNDTEQEFDFIVLTNDNKIIVFEAKTKLSSSYVFQQIKKTKNFMKISTIDKKINIFDEYFLVGFNSDSTCDEYYHFFIENYPVFKEETTKKAYNFKVPIPITGEEKFLNCLSDITYEGLLNKIEKGINAQKDASDEVLWIKKKNNNRNLGSNCFRKTKLFFSSRYLRRNGNFFV